MSNLAQDDSDLPERYAGLVDLFLSTTIADLIRGRAVRRLSEPMLYSLGAGGKRLRPVLCLLAAGVEVPETPSLLNSAEPGLRAALHLGAALECIHTYSLIHDDLPAMDDDDLRRGRPACHIQFGQWAAILAGDALNTFAFELLGLAFPGPEAGQNLADAVAILGAGSGPGGMICGQTLDLAYEKDNIGEIPLEDKKNLLREIHLKKTTALIRASLELGALVSGSDRAAYHAYGESLGLLFQISDDLLDRTGTAGSLGKTPGKDEAAGKLTYPALYGMDASREIAAALAQRAREQAAELKPGPLATVDRSGWFAALPDKILRRER